MTNMTPMQIFKNKLSLTLDNLSPGCQEINLNKAKGKTKCVQLVEDDYDLCFPNENNFIIFDKKEVKSDFVKIFKIKTKKENYSIAFHFEYLDNEIMDYKMRCSLKVVNKDGTEKFFAMSEKMNVTEFNEKLDLFNNELKNNFSNNIPDKINVINNVFLNQSAAPTIIEKIKLPF